MSAIPQELKMFLNRSVWLYAAVFFVFAAAVDHKQAAKERSHYLLGIFYNQELKNYSDGIVYFDYLIHQKPGDSRNYFLLGYCYLYSSNYSKACYYFERALKLSPDDAMYGKYLAHAKSKMLIDLLSTKRSVKSPNSIDNARRRFDMTKEKVNDDGNEVPLPTEPIQIPVE